MLMKLMRVSMSKSERWSWVGMRCVYLGKVELITLSPLRKELVVLLLR